MRGYMPAHTTSPKKKSGTKAKPAPRYFGFLAEIDFVEALGAHISRQEEEVGRPLRESWDALKKDKRVTHHPHVTIVRCKQLPDKLALWERCSALYAHPTPPLFRARLGHVVADERVMAVTVEELRVDNPREDEGQGSSFLSMLDSELRGQLHITVGTRDGSMSLCLRLKQARWWSRSRRVRRARTTCV